MAKLTKPSNCAFERRADAPTSGASLVGFSRGAPLNANIRLLRLMRLASVVTGFAALIGLLAIGSGLYGLYNLDFTEWAMKMGHAFDNPEYGNINADAWRAGYQISMAIFVSFGVAALIAAYGLLRRQRWAQYLWLVIVAIHIVTPMQDLPRLSAWVWLAVSAGIFVSSVLIFRAQRRAHAAP